MSKILKKTSKIYVSLLFKETYNEINMKDIFKKCTPVEAPDVMYEIDNGFDFLIQSISIYNDELMEFQDYETFLEEEHEDYYENTMNKNLDKNSPHFISGIFKFVLNDTIRRKELEDGKSFIIKYGKPLSIPSSINIKKNKKIYFSVNQSTVDIENNGLYDKVKQFFIQNEQYITSVDNMTDDVPVDWDLTSSDWEDELTVGRVYRLQTTEGIAEKILTIPALPEPTIQPSTSPTHFEDTVLVCVIEDNETTTSPGSS